MYRSLQTAEKALLLESVASLESGAKIAQVVKSSRSTLALGKELGLSTREMAQLKQAGKLEEAVSHTFEKISKNPATREPFELFKNAEIFLESYNKGFILEMEARALIGQTGIRTFPRPQGIPENFRIKISRNGAGMLYVHPEHTHTSIRVMPGKPHSPFPYQQKPYVIYRKNGKTLDKFGNVVDSAAPEAHIPIGEFVFKD